MVLHLLGRMEVRHAISAFNLIHIPLLIEAAKCHEVYHAYISPVCAFEGRKGFSDLVCLKNLKTMSYEQCNAV